MVQRFTEYTFSWVTVQLSINQLPQTVHKEYTSIVTIRNIHLGKTFLKSYIFNHLRTCFTVFLSSLVYQVLCSCNRQVSQNPSQTDLHAIYPYGLRKPTRGLREKGTREMEVTDRTYERITFSKFYKRHQLSDTLTYT